MNNIWTNDGTPNVQKSTILRHTESKDHEQAVKRSLKEEALSASGTLFDEETVELKGCKATDPDIFLIRTIYTLMKNEMPLEKVNAMLELQQLNGVEMPYKNLSRTTVTEIQNTTAAVLRKELCEKINNSEYFAILIDESTDITVSKRLSICVHYVYSGTAATSFLGNCEIPDGKAHTVTETLYNYLNNLNIDVSKCVSLATDGASVMMGKKSVVGVQLKAKHAPFLTPTHCVAHRLNLAVTDSIKQIEVLIKLKEKFANLYNFLSASSNRTFCLKQMQKLLEEPNLTVKEPYSIRWLGLKKAVEAVYESYGAILATLSQMAAENSTAKGLYKYFARYKTALLIGLMVDIHSELAVLCCQFQAQNLIFSDVAPLMDSTLGKLEYMKSQDGVGLSDMKSSITVTAFYKGDELTYYSKDVDSQFENVKKSYLDNLIKNVRKRIRKHDCEIFESLSKMLEPSTVKHVTSEESKHAITNLADKYGSLKIVKTAEGDLLSGVTQVEKTVQPLLNGQELEKEWQGVKPMIHGSYKDLSLPDLCQRLCLKHSEMFPNIAKLAQIAMCMEVTCVECERSFSMQNRIKSKFRSSLGNTSLESLLIVSLYGPPVADFNPGPSTIQWLAKSRRRKRLMQEYTPRAGIFKKQKLC